MGEILQPTLGSGTNIFTEEQINRMEKRIYWALIAVMFGLTLGALLQLNPFILFFMVLVVGFLNPDDRVRGKFL